MARKEEPVVVNTGFAATAVGVLSSARGWLLPAAMLIVLIAGVWTAYNRSRAADAEIRRDLLTQAAAIARTVDPALVKKLSFTAADEDIPSFRRLSAQLTAYAGAMRHRSIYSMAVRDGQMVFGPESLAKDDPFASPPGTVYESATPQDWAAFEFGTPYVDGPYTDEYGTFISAIYPVHDPTTGDVLMVIGMDITADEWRAQLSKEWYFPVIMAVGLVFMMAVALVILRWRARLASRGRGRLWHTETVLTALVGVVLTGCLVLLVREVEDRSNRATLVQIANSQRELVEDAFYSVEQSSLNSARLFEASEQVTRYEFRAYFAPLLESTIVDAYGWVPIVPAAQRMEFEADVSAAIGDEFEIFEVDGEGVRTSAANRTTYYPVVYAEPFGVQGDVLGYDLGSDPVLLSAIEGSILTQLSTATDPITWVEASGPQQAILILQPVLEEDEDVEGGERATGSFVVAVLSPQSLLRESVIWPSSYRGTEEMPAHICLFQLSLDGPPERLASSMPGSDTALQSFDTMLRGPGSDMCSAYPIFVFGKAYAAVVCPGPAFWDVRAVWGELAVIGVVGLLMTVFLTGFTGFLRSAGYLLEQQVRVRTAELRASEGRYRTFINSTTDLVFVKDSALRYVMINRAQEEFFGRPEDEIQGMTDDDLMGPELAESCRQSDRRAIEREEIVTTVESVGNRLYETRKFPVSLSDDDAGVGAFIRDVTEMKRAEARVAHLNRVLFAVRDINQLIIHEKDPEALIRRTCDLLWEHRGYSGVLIVLTNDDNVPYAYAQAGIESLFEPVEEGLKRGELPVCCWLAREEGGVAVINDRGEVCAGCSMLDYCVQGNTVTACLRYGERDFGYLIASVSDKLELNAEEWSIFGEMARDVAFALQNIEMGEAMRWSEEERARMEADLRQAQKMEAVGRLAGGVAHDFNNMLNVILGYAGLALESLDPDEPLHHDLEEIDRAARRFAGLTHQLLAFSRKQDVVPGVVNLNTLISQQTKMLGRLIGEDIEIDVHPASDLWAVYIDPTQIDQILVNLAANARDAIDGVGTISIETANVNVDENYSAHHVDMEPGDYVLMSFSDTGSGIEKKALEHVFEPFFTTKEKGKGTGLGLATVYGIVKQSGGAIHVYSEQGRGTTLKIYLPRYEASAEEQVIEAVEAPRGGTETILVVEDEAQILSLVQRMLQANGYSVLQAGSPDEACEIAEQFEGKIDMLLTDVVMPSMSGKDLHARIKAMRPEIKTMFMSGYTASVVVGRGLIDDGITLLQKPFSLDVLVRSVRELLDN